MPTYTYQCQKCEVAFEAVQSMKDEPLKDCPECQAENSLQKLILTTGGGFRIYGRGVHKPTSRIG